MVRVSLDFTRHFTGASSYTIHYYSHIVVKLRRSIAQLWRTFSVSIQTMCRRATSDEEKFRWKFNKMYHYPGGVVLKNVYKMWRECGMLQSHITFSLCTITSNDIDIGMWGVVWWGWNFFSRMAISLHIESSALIAIAGNTNSKSGYYSAISIFFAAPIDALSILLSTVLVLNGHRWSSRKMVEIFLSATWRSI